MATRKSNENVKNDTSLPFAALQLLAPPVRLVSAALWKVLKQKDVMQYGVVEEFVTSACETVPGLLTLRHQGKLTLGLRARLILELCRTQTNAKELAPHLERIRVPAALSSSASTVKKDVKLMKTVESFHSFIHTLLTNPAEREHFFKETFPVDYGPNFDHELEKLLWEFLIRLDQLLPVPNLAQTVSWLSEAPPVLEECAQAATQPQLLKILLQHQTCLGHLESAASLPPNMGDSILASLSLPPSGKIPSNPLTASSQSSAELSNDPQPGGTTPFIRPVIGLISNENVPLMISARKRTLLGDEATSEHLTSDENSEYTLVKQRQKPEDGGKEDQEEEEEEEEIVLKRRSGVKRKQAHETENETDEELFVFASGEKRTNGERQQKRSGSDEDEAQSVKNEGYNSKLVAASMSKHGLRNLRLPDDPSLCSIVTSCLDKQLKVVIRKLPLVSPSSTSTSGSEGKSFYGERPNDGRKRSTRKRTSSRQASPCPGLDDKENRPVSQSVSSPSSQQREMATLQGDGDESYVADSEDEATKNFKGRLFIKRYYKTKHGTYVPTLREYWRPSVTRRGLLSAASKRR